MDRDPGDNVLISMFRSSTGEELVEIYDDGVEIETFGRRTCLRLKASNWRTKVTARSAASSMWRISLLQLPAVQAALQSHLEVTFDDSQKIIEIVRDPPASLPTASICGPAATGLRAACGR